DKNREASRERISRSSDSENLERPLSFSLQKAGMAVVPILTVCVTAPATKPWIWLSWGLFGANPALYPYLIVDGELSLTCTTHKE
ncbi:MAG: hypothetical protein ACYCVG_09640, partial [Leptospirillum sp.]